MTGIATSYDLNFIDHDLLLENADRIVSLGSFCITSSILKRFGLKTTSMPFDWLFAAPDVVIDCIDNDFSHFLDKNQHVSLTEHRGSPAAGHRHYDRDYFAQATFNHRDITRDHDYGYYERCIDRFRALLHSKQDKLFVVINDRLGQNEAAFRRISAKLREVTTGSHLVAISLNQICHEPGCLCLRKTFDQDGHRFYNFQPSSISRGVHFDDDMDNLAVIRLISNAVSGFRS